MIDIIGVTEGSEYEAALHFKSQLVKLWPDLINHKKDHVKIIVGLKIFGYKTQDVDLIVLGTFSDPRQFSVEFEFQAADGLKYIPREAFVRNFALLIEVKSHDASGVQFNGAFASVKYTRNGTATWEEVTEKNRKQVFDFKKYLESKGVGNLYVQNLVFFSGLKESDLPKRPHNCVGINASFERWLNIIGQISTARKTDRTATIAHGTEDIFSQLFSPNFSLIEALQPSSLDRQRMDRIARNEISEDWINELGAKQLLFRGRGGTGKTIMMLQMAYRAFDHHQRRSLVLTFNKALVADMSRIMALMGVPKNVRNGGISVETVHTYIRRIMTNLGMIQPNDDFLNNYDALKKELLGFLNSEAISKDDIARLKLQHGMDHDWDLIFVDEGQDWPSDEISILRKFYESHQMIISDGIDQFVRDSVADWSIGVDRKLTSVKRLQKCLRMKANLAHFTLDIAQQLNLEDWQVEPNTEAGGGRVIIVEGDLLNDPNLYNQLKADAQKLGNYPVDMLACVPPNHVERLHGEAVSKLSLQLAKMGNEYWDGVSYETREHYPTKRDALRIVQYESCRGLEGWTVINYGFDDFWDLKLQFGLSNFSNDDFMDNSSNPGRSYAARWIMIPLTRAIDTLVINISSRDSEIKRVLQNVASKRPDFVEYIYANKAA